MRIFLPHSTVEDVMVTHGFVVWFVFYLTKRYLEDVAKIVDVEDGGKFLAIRNRMQDTDYNYLRCVRIWYF